MTKPWLEKVGAFLKKRGAPILTHPHVYDDLTEEGTRLTPEFVAFLKDED